MSFERITGVVLIILGFVMFYLAYRMNGLPPAVTGVGFLLIGLVMLKRKWEG